MHVYSEVKQASRSEHPNHFLNDALRFLRVIDNVIGDYDVKA